MFHAEIIFPGVTHITDAMGVSMTLIEGEQRAILFDTGYGTENVKAYVQTLTGKPVSVLLSHGHHDHILGQRWFEESRMCSEDLEEFRQRTGIIQREKVAEQAVQKGVEIPADFLSVRFRDPLPIRFTGKIGRFEQETEDLGNLQVKIIHVPGHTPGSVCLYNADEKLLISGDTVFYQSWGRTDFPGGSESQIQDSLSKLYRKLPPDTLVYPGHEYYGFKISENF